MWLHVEFAAALCVLQCFVYSIAEEVLVQVSGTVGASNSSFYKLQFPGYVIVRLVTTNPEGDADLYVSSGSLKPTYSNYDQKATTCGVEEIHLSSYTERPVGVAVLGDSLHEISNYQLTVTHNLDLEHAEQMFERMQSMFSYSPSDIDESGNPKDRSKQNGDSSRGGDSRRARDEFGEEEEEESLIWTVFVGILKLILDILL